MSMDRDHGGMIVLSRADCLRLLHAQPAQLGRVAVVDEAGCPTAYPVRYRLVGEQVVFRTDEQTLLDAAACRARVAFEIEDVESAARSGWSVLARGRIHEVIDRLLIDRADVTPPVLAIDIADLSGRRIR